MIGGTLNFNGTYRGLSPTLDSAVAWGELELVIDDVAIRYRLALGSGIEAGEWPRSQLEPLSVDRVNELWHLEVRADPITGFTFGEAGPDLLFLSVIPDMPASAGVLILRFVSAEIDDLFGPSILFTPGQVAEGRFDAAVTELEHMRHNPGGFPRLAHGGSRH